MPALRAGQAHVPPQAQEANKGIRPRIRFTVTRKGRPDSTFPASQIQPVGRLSYQGAVSDAEGFGVVVVGIHQEKVGNGRKAPLQAGIDVDVFQLVVVLQENGEEEAAAKGQVDAGPDEENGSAVDGQVEVIVIDVELDGAIGLVAIGERAFHPVAVTVEELAHLRVNGKRKFGAPVRLIFEFHAAVVVSLQAGQGIGIGAGGIKTFQQEGILVAQPGPDG